jgi:hypothetical protein
MRLDTKSRDMHCDGVDASIPGTRGRGSDVMVNRYRKYFFHVPHFIS